VETVKLIDVNMTNTEVHYAELKCGPEESVALS